MTNLDPLQYDPGVDQTSSAVASQPATPQAPAPETAPPYQIPDSISKENPIFLTDPDTNDKYSVNNAKTAQMFLSHGYQPETKDELMQRVVAANIKDRPVESSVLAAAGSFSNQFFGGLPQLVNENSPISSKQDNDTQKAIDAEIAKENPLTTLAFGTMGTAAMLLATAGSGFALEKFGDSAVKAVQSAAVVGGNTAAKVASSAIAKTAVKYGAENAVLNLPYRVTESILGDPQTAGEGIMARGLHVAAKEAEDFGVGAGFGLGTSLIGPVISGAARVASSPKTAEFLTEEANRAKLKNTGALTTEIKKLGDITGEEFTPNQLQATADILDKYTNEWDQFGGPGKILEKMQKAKQKAATTLTSMRQQSDIIAPEGISYSQASDGLNQLRSRYTEGNLNVPGTPAATMGPLNSYDNVTADAQRQAFDGAMAKFGDDWSAWPKDAFEQVINSDAQIPATSGVSNIDARATPDIQAIGFFQNALRSDAIKKMRISGMNDQQIAQAFDTGQGLPSFGMEELHKFRQSVKDKIFNPQMPNGIQTDGGTDSWNLFGNMMDGYINKAVASSPQKLGLPATFKEANASWRELHQFTEHILKSAYARAQARNDIGLTASIMGLGGEALNGNLGGLTGLALGLAKQKYGNYIKYRTLGAMSSVLENATGDVGNAIGSLLTSEPAKAAELGSVNVWSRYMGEKDADPHKAFNQLQNDISYAQSKPESIGSVLSVLAPNAAQFAPQTYTMMGATAQNAMKYLQDTAPKPPPPIFPGGPNRPWQPTDNELSKYSRRLSAVMNPTSILSELKTGTLSKESVDAVRTVYPKFFTSIQSEVQRRLAMAPAGQIYGLRQKLNLIIDGTEDPTAKAQRLQGLQAGFAPNNNHVEPRANSKIDEAGRYETPLSKANHE